MIIVKLTGGLGNQMFQYALARALAEKNSTILKLDVSHVSNLALNRDRLYALGVFNVIENFASQEEINLFINSPGTVMRLVNRLFKKTPVAHIRESVPNQFDPNILNLGNNIYLDGYWQAVQYVDFAAPVIRSEFCFKEVPSPGNRRILDMIEKTESVSIHIRRGDYVSDPECNAKHGTCSLGYYSDAINTIQSNVSNPYFFVFSDDISWARENLKIDAPHKYVDQNDTCNAHEDLRLMMHCKHHIIANSSFSWWGAYLSNNPDKMVISPMEWLRIDRPTNDLIPSSWLRL